MKKKDAKKEHYPLLPYQINAMNGVPGPLVTDPNGSYTGRALDPNEKPVQDADDL